MKRKGDQRLEVKKFELARTAIVYVRQSTTKQDATSVSAVSERRVKEEKDGKR